MSGSRRNPGSSELLQLPLAHAVLRIAPSSAIKVPSAHLHSLSPAALGAPPLSEGELNALIKIWTDPRRRQEVMLAWARDAQKRYREAGR